MRRILIVLLILAISMISVTGAWAATIEENIDLASLRKYERVNNLCWIGDTLYILGDEGLYTWQQGSGATMLIDMKLTAPLRYMEQPPANAENEWKQAVHRIFTDGNKLYALQQYSGQVSMLEGQSLELWRTLPTEQLYTTGENERFRGISDIAWASGKLYLLIGTDDPEQWDKTALLAYDPATEQMTACAVEGVRQIGPALDGKLLITRTMGTDAQTPVMEVSYYDPATGAEEKQVALEATELSAGVVYDSKQNALIYCQGQDIVRHTVDGTAQAQGTLPLSMGGLSSKAQLSDSGLFAGAGGQYIFVRDITGEAAPQKLELRVMGDINPDTIVRFSMANPDVTVRTVPNDSSESLQQAIVSAGSTIDLYVVKVPGPYAAMRKKGFLAPLNDSVTLVDKVKQMYPAVQDALVEGEQLLGVPINAQAYSWTLNQTLWDEFDLGGVPATYPALLEGLVRWEDEYADDNPNYKFLDLDQDVNGFVTAIVREYILQNERQDAPMTFDTPAFRETLHAVIDNRSVIQDNAEKEGMPIIFTYSMGFGVGSNDGEKTMMMLPPALSSGEQQALAVSMEVLVVNAASEHKSEALRLVEFIAEQVDMSQQYMLTPSLMDAARAGSYEENAAKLDGDIATLEGQAQSAPDDKKAEIADALVTKKTQRQNLENFAWLISPESVTCYRELAQNLRVPFASNFLSEEANSGMASLEPIINKFCSQDMSPAALDTFIRDLDSVARMIYQEGM